jgi:hypothetical protein
MGMLAMPASDGMAPHLATSRSLGWPARETCFVVIAILSSKADDASQIGSPASGLPTYAGISSGEGTAAH